MPDGWELWRDWLKFVSPGNVAEIQAVETDTGRYFAYIRAVGRRGAEAQLVDLNISIPAEYQKKTVAS